MHAVGRRMPSFGDLEITPRSASVGERFRVKNKIDIQLVTVRDDRVTTLDGS